MKKLFSLILTLCLVLSIAIPVFSAGAELAANELRFCRKVIDDRDVDGNLRKPYWVDADGNEIAMPEPEVPVSAATETTLPEKYDLRERGVVTSVKNQAKVGSCWAFSTIACMESSMIWQGYGRADDIDYSEAHLAWFSQRQRTPDPADLTYGDGYDAANPFDDGSNIFFSSSTLMRGSGVQLESNAPWSNPQNGEEAMRDMAQPESDRYVSYGRLSNARWLVYSVAGVKQTLMQNGNVSAAYLHYPDGWNEVHACQYQNVTNMYVNHGVEIVGWDDSFSKENFNENMRPRFDGAWLVKGSWGTEFGEDGYYWLSYADPSISCVFTMVATPKQTFDHIYQYDGTIPLTTVFSNASLRAANRFRSTRQEMLTHVAFWSENYHGVDGCLSVYVADEDYVPDPDNPTTNMTLVEAAKTYFNDVQCGYYTFELSAPVDVSNRYYTVELLYYNDPEWFTTLSLEGTGSTTIHVENDLSYGAEPGQSFIYDNKWNDVTQGTALSGKHYNVPIKAMTRESAKPTGFTLSYDATIGSGAPDKQIGSTKYYISMREPVCTTLNYPTHTFLGWAASEGARLPQFKPGDQVALTADTTLYAVWEKVERPVVVDPEAPTVSIVNYVSERTERFFTTVEFTSEATNMPDEAQIVWYVNSKEAQKGGATFVYSGAKRNYNVQAQIRMIHSGLWVASSQTETVRIKFTFADIFTALFRILFGKPYYVKQ